jgi:PAT family beta-lactamase induction signal transducer AmpG
MPFASNLPPAQRQAALAATYQTGYRLAMIWWALWIAARASVGCVAAAANAAPVASAVPLPRLSAGVAGYQRGAWQTAYLVMAASMLPGVLTVLFSTEPAQP